MNLQLLIHLKRDHPSCQPAYFRYNNTQYKVPRLLYYFKKVLRVLHFNEHLPKVTSDKIFN